MNKTIHKYELRGSQTIIDLPLAYIIVHVGEQAGTIMVWVELDPNEPKIPYTFHIIPTGGEITENMYHAGSVIIPPFVWHVYYEWPGEETHTLEHGNQVLKNVHDPSVCAGDPCTIHNMTDHHMRGWPQHWRDDRHIMERICPHGVGHPDPDERSDIDTTHACDGCCAPLEKGNDN